MYSKRFPIKTVQKLLGHCEIEITMRYLAADSMSTPEAKEAVTEVFAGVAEY
jgi:hypothetical protein